LDVKIQPRSLSGNVKAIPSKSQAHRALICASLAADNLSFIECSGDSNDIEATASCLRALGAEIRRENQNDQSSEGYFVRPLEKNQNDISVSLPCVESGSTFRFLLPIVCALGKKTNFLLEGRLPERPISPLYEELSKKGCKLSPKGLNPFCTEGKLSPGIFELDAGVSSQFISGLLFALPLLEADSKIHLKGRVESFPYIEMTLAMLEIFKIKIEFKENIFYIKGNQKYISPEKLRIEGDWSNAAFWLAAAALGENAVTCEGLDLQSKQGDKAVINILEKFGANIKKHGSSVTVSGGKLRGAEIDARDIPDLVPVLAVAACAAQEQTVIRNAGRLRIKESDRLEAVSSVLRALGADIRVTDDGLIINGGSSLTGGEVSSWGDHRMAMSAAVASILCSQQVVIKDAQAVNKSYPGFFDDFRLLGGSITII